MTPTLHHFLKYHVFLDALGACLFTSSSIKLNISLQISVQKTTATAGCSFGAAHQ